MVITHSNKKECWLYEEPNQNTCLIDIESGLKTANIFRVSFDKILYVTSFNIKKGFLQFVTEDGTKYYKRLTLKEVVNANDSFIFTRKDTVVNVSHVTKRCDWLSLWVDKYQFDISRQYRKQVKERFELFVL